MKAVPEDDLKPGRASLLVRALDERESFVELDCDRLTVGRPTPESRPDVALEPDPQRWVSRLHCTLENRAGAWSLSDNATVNGTLLRRGGLTQRISGPVLLADGDTICILGSLTPAGEPLYWELTFRTSSESHTTNQAPPGLHAAAGDGAAAACVEYDFVQARVFRRDDAGRTEVTGLRPKAHQLIRYMAGVSRNSGGSPVACSHAELIRALWGEPEEWPPYHSYSKQDLRDVVLDIRKHIEPNPKRPRLLETVRGFGYRLALSPEPADQPSGSG